MCTNPSQSAQPLGIPPSSAFRPAAHGVALLPGSGFDASHTRPNISRVERRPQVREKNTCVVLALRDHLSQRGSKSPSGRFSCPPARSEGPTDAVTVLGVQKFLCFR